MTNQIKSLCPTCGSQTSALAIPARDSTTHKPLPRADIIAFSRYLQSYSIVKCAFDTSTSKSIPVCACGNSCTTAREDHTLYYNHLIPILQCICGRRYQTVSALRLHMRKEHPDFDLPTQRPKQRNYIPRTR